jgi:hypothetical protein
MELIKAWIGMLEYMSVMSKEENFKSGFTWISFRSEMRCVVFLTSKVYGRGTNIKDVLAQFSNIMPTMKLIIEKETDNTIHFLDITVTKTHDSLTFNIYRKPTTTDTIIPKHSCHPPEHKSAAVNFLSNR